MKKRSLLILTLLDMFQLMFLHVYLQAFYTAKSLIRKHLKPYVSRMEEVNNQQGIFTSALHIVTFIL